MKFNLAQGHLGYGAISPSNWGDKGSDEYKGGVKALSNFIVRPQGGVTRRRGTEYMGVSSSNEMRIVPFAVKDKTYLIVVGGDTNISVYEDDGTDTLVEFATPDFSLPDASHSEYWGSPSTYSVYLMLNCSPEDIPFGGWSGPVRLTTSGTLPTGLTGGGTDYAVYVARDPANTKDSDETFSPIGIGFWNWGTGVPETPTSAGNGVLTLTCPPGSEARLSGTLGPAVVSPADVTHAVRDGNSIYLTGDDSGDLAIKVTYWESPGGSWLAGQGPCFKYEHVAFSDEGPFRKLISTTTDDLTLSEVSSSNHMDSYNDKAFMTQSTGSTPVHDTLISDFSSNPNGYKMFARDKLVDSNWCVADLSVKGSSSADQVTMRRPFPVTTATIDCDFYGFGNFVDGELGTYAAGVGGVKSMAIYAQRMGVVFRSDPAVIYASAVGAPKNHLPVGYDGVIDDAVAFSFKLSGTNDIEIRGLDGHMKDLMIFTESGVWAATVSGREALTYRVNSIGGSNVVPVMAEEHLVYTGPGARKLYALTYTGSDADKYITTELTEFSDHVIDSDIKRMVYKHEPYRSLWVVREDGLLASCSVADVRRRRFGFSSHSIAGDTVTVQDIAALEANGGGERNVYFVIKRDLNSVTKYTIERLAQSRPYGEVIADSKYLDCSVLYDGGSTTTPTGFDHLNGETVRVLADGVDVGTKTVSGGTFTLSVAASKVLAGYAYNSDIEPLQQETSISSIGVTDGVTKTVSSVSLLLEDTYGGKVGHESANLDTVEYDSAAASLFSGVKRVKIDGDPGVVPGAYVRFDGPFPADVNELIFEVDYSGRGGE
jgi:hypothetical protein